MGSAEGKETTQGIGGRGEERILVSVRVRPLSEKEASRNDIVDWECANDTTIVYKNHLSPERSMYPTSYTFDRVFRCDCSTRQVYEEGAKAVVLSVVSGINSSVFAYGQTSSGKTFTMSGITEYTMEDIFSYIEKHTEREFHLKFSAMEIYNESVRDLLTADNSPLRLLDDPERGTVVEKLTEETLRDWNHFKELLAVCEAQRQIGETFLNEASSRSHQILRLTIESSTREFLGKNNTGTLAASLNFVDLAGSERASQALSAGSRLKEGSHINRSLLTLGTVIRKLSKGRTGHIPFRDSKLTRILQSSLGGNARIAVICTMSPARSYAEQSRNTLLFASCAKEITTDARVNVVMSEKALVKHLQRELARLQSELRSSSPSQQADASDVLREKDSKIEELERQVRQLTLQLNLAMSQIHHLQHEDRSPTIWEREDSSYSKLYVRQVSENSPSDATAVTDHRLFISGPLALETPRSPDRHSRVSYDENYSISDFEDNTLPSSPFDRMFTETPSDTSPSLSIQTPIVAGNKCCQFPEGVAEETNNHSEVDSCIVSEEIGEQSPNSYEIVPCQVSEEISGQTPDTFEMHLQQVSDGHGSQAPYFVEFDQYHVLDVIGDQTPNSYEHDCHQVSLEIAENTLNDHIDSVHIPEATREQTDEHLEDYCKEVQCIECEMSDDLQANSSTPVEGESLLMGHENGKCEGDERRQKTALGNTNSSSPQHAEGPSGKQQIIDMPECKNLNHVDRRSCQSNDTSCRPSTSLEKDQYEMKSEDGDGGGGFSVTLEETQMLSALGQDVDDDVSQTSTGDIELDEISVTDVKISNHIDNAENLTCDTKRKDIAEPQYTKQFADSQLEDVEHKGNEPIKSTKDGGLNPQDDLDTSPCWHLDSKKLQREIIDLWDTCNVSLVHRTYFFLLFINGEPADTIYMEVERRRLSFIKDAFSWGNSVVLDGRKLTPSSSKRSLHHEREKLGRLMKRRLRSQERIDLYLKWGINLDTKRRSSQLAHRLWKDPADTDHILDSANIVARLIQFSEPQVPKEVFGLDLMTKEARRKSFRW